jgi:hypothetical protein
VRASPTLGPQIHLLVFDAALQPLDEHVVPSGAFAVHADRHAIVGEHAGEGLPCASGAASFSTGEAV